MQIRQIRNATIKIHYGGKIFLVDPWLAPRTVLVALQDFPNPFPLKRRILRKHSFPCPSVRFPQRLMKFLQMWTIILLLISIRIILIWRWTEQLGIC